MATHASAVKQHRKSIKKHQRNRAVQSTLKTLVKKLNTSLADKKPEESRSLLMLTTTVFDRAASKGIIPPNTAARKISRLTVKVNKLLSSEKSA
jgi:small subunit ribosomal protein S20